MTRTGEMHAPPVSKSKPALIIVEIFKEALGPLSTNDIYEAAKAKGITLSSSAIGANLYTIWRDKGVEGYSQSRAVKFPGEKTPRYWLTAAPGWSPRWIVTQDYRVVPAGSADALTIGQIRPGAAEEIEPGEIDQQTAAPQDQQPRLCQTCDAPLIGPLPFCSDICKETFFGVKG
jgi:hypothetical protein